jgi:glycosyltransferase involved in cell wall biosynthesis
MRFYKYDIIIVQLFSYKAFLLEDVVIRLGNLLGKKTIAVIRGGAFPEFYNRYPNWSENVLNRCYKIETPSIYIQHYLQAKGFVVGHIPNFIDNEHFPFNWENTKSPKLLWVRAFHDIYKPELAIQCVAHLKSKFPELTLTMVGPDQGKLEYCKNLIKSLNIESSVTITGPIPNHELNAYYKSHQVFLTTTSYESFGVALVEAACSGIPMVSTKVGEIPFMWKEDEEMLMAKDGDQVAFNEKVEKLLSDTTLREKLSFNARKKAEKYTWDAIKVRWKELIEG